MVLLFSQTTFSALWPLAYSIQHARGYYSINNFYIFDREVPFSVINAAKYTSVTTQLAKKCESGEAWLYIAGKRGGCGNESESKRVSEQGEKERSRISLRGWESVLNTCFPYRIHFEPQSAVALMPAWRSSLLHARPLPRRRASRGRKGREEGRWFISFLNNSLLFSSSLSVAATFWSIAFDTSTTIHFYLRSNTGGRWDSSPLPSSSCRSLVLLLVRPAVCDFISLAESLPVPSADDRCVCQVAKPLMKNFLAKLFDELTFKRRIQEFTHESRCRVDFAIKILSHLVDFTFGRYNMSLFWRYVKNVCVLKIKAIKGKIFLQKSNR